MAFSSYVFMVSGKLDNSIAAFGEIQEKYGNKIPEESRHGFQGGY